MQVNMRLPLPLSRAFLCRPQGLREGRHSPWLPSVASSSPCSAPLAAPQVFQAVSQECLAPRPTGLALPQGWRLEPWWDLLLGMACVQSILGTTQAPNHILLFQTCSQISWSKRPLFPGYQAYAKHASSFQQSSLSNYSLLPLGVML